MLGWEFFITRKGEPDDHLARWMAGIHGLAWIERLLADGVATDHDTNIHGYPFRYQLPAGVLVDVLRNGLPKHGGPDVIGDDYVLPGGWTGRATIGMELLRSLDPEEILQIEAWDQS